jgi:hypothetical protein
MSLIRKQLTSDEFSPPNVRYDEGTDEVQVSPDGGTTWVDTPELDPRHSEAARLPALTGSDKQCRAAAGMTNLVRQLVDERIASANTVVFAGSIIGIAAFIPGFNVLWALVVTLATFGFTIAIEILEAAFTEGVYDQIRCIFFCNIDDEGQMSASQFIDCYAQMAELDAIAQSWVESIMLTFGEVGLSDAGVSLEEAADCDECECLGDWGIEFDFADQQWGFVPSAPYGGYMQWVSGSGFQSLVPDSGYYFVYIGKTFTLPDPTNITRVEADVYAPDYDNTYGFSFSPFVGNISPPSGEYTFIQDRCAFPFGGTPFSAILNINLQQFTGGTGIIRRIRFYGDGLAIDDGVPIDPIPCP